MSSPRIQRALISVSDKTGLVPLAHQLVAAGVEIYSTGGTRKHLEAAGLPVQDVSAYTSFPEIMDGRVKTLHPKVFGGILCRHDNAEDRASLAEHGIRTFELVVVNLYPFRETVAKQGVAFEEAIEQIDIGGPSLVRAAAKNHAFTSIATSPARYEEIAAEIKAGGATSPELRRELAAAAFAHTADYDAAIATWFAGQLGTATLDAAGAADALPEQLNIALRRKLALRYGENPHQRAGLYVDAEDQNRNASHGSGTSLALAPPLHGKELSYNNLLDLDSALAIVRGLARPAVSVIKHNNPCGAAIATSAGESLGEITRRALDGDPVSAFGSVLGFNRPVDTTAAEVLAEPGRFVEAIVAPSFEPAALEILTTKPKWKANVRLVAVGELMPAAESRATAALDLRSIDGGVLVQDRDAGSDDPAAWKVATLKSPIDAQLAALAFAWAIVRYVKSNAIVVVQAGTLVGVGAGQMSRVDSVEIALRKAGDRAKGAVLASDAFFPFPDSIELAAKAGIAAVIQPGGSVKDAEVVAACNRCGLAMLFTGRRHFKH
ncbi:MAG: bifunctional phosphoribosylaminoimidazolecarboxamide formyltransferase/IMP cyclohydrolase [Pirellulales bacterium]|nr:bifunctional phosphoribosylaminoimidazolecarboxamide formyltransferase/IMP cyclohydrolase [Pirellulales bacterium]